MRGWRYDARRHSLAARGITTSRYLVRKKVPINTYGWKDDKKDASGYIHENVDGDGSSPEKKMHDFKKGVKETVFSPGKDLDGEWTEYTKTADNEYYGAKGKPEKLSSDGVERVQQRGAALVGRVVSQANVEPLIDDEDGRTFRESMMDFTFGRRL